MIVEYIRAALDRAEYETTDDAEPYHGEVPGLDGIWASGETLEECRWNLADMVEAWIAIRLEKGLPLPLMGEHEIKELKSL